MQLQEPTDPALLAEQIKMFQVPYKILCKVVNVELKVRNCSGAGMFSTLHPVLPCFCFLACRARRRNSFSLVLSTGEQAEMDTDEVYAQITLQPDPDVSVPHHHTVLFSIFIFLFFSWF